MAEPGGQALEVPTASGQPWLQLSSQQPFQERPVGGGLRTLAPKEEQR